MLIEEKDDAERKAFFVFQTIFSVARLAGYQIHGDLTIHDWNGTEHKSSEIMPKYRHRKDV